MKLNKKLVKSTAHVANNSWRGVIRTMYAVLACGMIADGIHLVGLHIQKSHQKVDNVKIQRALADENVVTPTSPVKRKHDFVHRFAEVNESLPKEDRVTTSLLIAQAGLESDWGVSPLYKKANNPFGVKGKYHGNYMDYYTGENDKDGNPYTELAGFRQYPSLADAVRDHNRLLKKKFLKGSHNDYVSQAKALQHNHYATDPNYAQKLMIYVQANHLTKFD